jgi:hypothetical protein
MKAIKTLFALFALFAATSTIAAQYSKLGIITAAKQAGKWPALKAWIAASGYEDEWQAAAFFSDDYPAFAAITNTVIATGIATGEEVAAILSAAQDKAPDALLSVVYNRDVQTSAGRVKWHGKRMGQYLLDDGNGGQSLVELYEDGFVWTNAAQRVTLADPEAAAKAKAAAEARQAEWERANLPPDIAALLAARRAAATTNEITVVVGP